VALTVGPAEDPSPEARRPARHRPPDAAVVQDRRALEAARA
jgi:hypothetical protein